MKFTSEDFRDQLAGGMDKLEAVARIKEVLSTLGYKCKIQRRKTAKGRKIYFIIEPTDDDREFPSPWWKESEGIIRAHFPDSHITSGSSSGWTIAEYR